MKYAQAERLLFCDLVEQVGPDAPTLCAGWDAADLVAHLILRENDPVAVAGMAVPALVKVTRRRMDALLAGAPFAELVARLRSGPDRFSLYRLPGVAEAANFVEFFVHVEDVRRAGSAPLPPRELPAGMQGALWRRLGLMGRLLLRRAPGVVALERAGTQDRLQFGKGSTIVHLIGESAELVLYLFGRATVAEVEVVGDPDAVAALQPALGL